ncbi:amidase family protein [Vagococcus xieshaowenii]|uniref:Amidase domain-containing protein n=1 Tax=Vagococcus xieshaowenii TaxID=2562451 RepID=A0AAJ5EG30_9ENTE|nr:amidase family protein [Vagococcus xieshaowenii]QCA28869.1 hypothetical protein E4Z98_05880 [Vagococcus xieshaowenii]TFZ43286.1 hypothetical protein E4031_00250 [Vagococcus xieshaowenii]
MKRRNNRIKEYAKKTFVAISNPYKSVIKTYPNSIDNISDSNGYYFGTKNVSLISNDLIKKMETLNYFHHTVDKASHSGRAIDIDLKNPITGKPMTGSSSGTAINVFLRINDVGVGTDGGGSVLAPAMSLNLFGFIHPTIGKDPSFLYEKKISTDGIVFAPSIGLISRELFHIEKLVSGLLEIESFQSKLHNSITVLMDEQLDEKFMQKSNYKIEKKNMNNKYKYSRKDLIEELDSYLSDYDIVISKEGPVDLNGLGDTIYGHFDNETKEKQKLANKGYIRVANMLNVIVLTVPTNELSTGYVIMAKNNIENIQKIFEIANKFQINEDGLIESYFGNLKNYFERGI